MNHHYPWIASLFLFFAGVSCVQSLQAKVYVWVKPDGTKVYTDAQPPEGVEAEVIEMNPVATVPAFDASNTPKGKAVLEVNPKSDYGSCSIQYPPNDYVLVAAEMGNTMISLASQPPLQTDHQWRIALGDQVYKQADGLLKLEGLYRGSYQVSADIISQDNKVLCQTEAIQFHVKRHIAN